MDRKYRYRTGKRHQPCAVRRNVKKHLTGTSSVEVSNYHFEMKQEVIDVLMSHTQFEGNEECGVLMGSHVGENRYRICKVSPPCVRQNARCVCERDAEMANRFIKDDFEQSENTRFYIGEWHTHPENSPTPSAVDCRSIEDNYHSASLVVPFLLMVIVGRESFYISVYNGKEFVKVEPEVV